MCELRMFNENGTQLSTFCWHMQVAQSATNQLKSEDYFNFASLEQLRKDIGILSNLMTAEKGSLVAAINYLESAKQGLMDDISRIKEEISEYDEEISQNTDDISALPHYRGYAQMQAFGDVLANIKMDGAHLILTSEETKSAEGGIDWKDRPTSTDFCLLVYRFAEDKMQQIAITYNGRFFTRHVKITEDGEDNIPETDWRELVTQAEFNDYLNNDNHWAQGIEANISKLSARMDKLPQYRALDGIQYYNGHLRNITDEGSYSILSSEDTMNEEYGFDWDDRPVNDDGALALLVYRCGENMVAQIAISESALGRVYTRAIKVIEGEDSQDVTGWRELATNSKLEEIKDDLYEEIDAIQGHLANIPQYRTISDTQEYNAAIANIQMDGIYPIFEAEEYERENQQDWSDRPAAGAFSLFVNRVSDLINVQIAVSLGGDAGVFRRTVSRRPDDGGNYSVLRDWRKVSSTNVILALGDSLCAGDRNCRKGFVGDLGLPYINRGQNLAALGACSFNGVPLQGPWRIHNQLVTAFNDGIEADIIIADGGVNDYVQNNTLLLGNLPEAPAESEDYFTEERLATTIGGLEKLLFEMWRLYPKARKFFLIPHKLNCVTLEGSDEKVDYMTTKNEQDKTMTDYFEAIKNVCAVYKVEVIDVCNDSEIDMTLEKYKSAWTWTDRLNEKNFDFLTATDWIDKDGHPFACGYSHGYLPVVHKALFGSVPEEASPFFTVYAKVTEKEVGEDGIVTKVSASPSVASVDIVDAHESNKQLVLVIADTTDGDIYSIPLSSATFQEMPQSALLNSWTFTFNSNKANNPFGRKSTYILQCRPGLNFASITAQSAAG